MGVSKAQIILLPWDPEASEHVERLYQQRIACGWNQDAVEGWRQLQREGKIALHWVVISEADPTISSKLAIHTTASPTESSTITDTAPSLGGKPRVPNPLRSFIPVGHISLDSTHEDPTCADASRGIYRISTFYISTALQGGGIGRAAMDEMERLAMGEPLNARMLTLMTIAREYEGKREKWEALRRQGVEEPTFSNQDWYARRGYEAYKLKDGMWPQADSEGRVWLHTAVFMRKDIR